MTTNRIIVILILAAAALFPIKEIAFVLGPAASLTVAAGIGVLLVFTLGHGKVGAMAGNRGYATEENEGPRPQYYIRLSPEDKQEIIDGLYAKILADASTSIVKKLLLAFLTGTLALASWFASNHINIK